MKFIYSILIACFIITIGCKSDPAPTITGVVLNSRDRHLCDSLQIDSSVLLAVRAHTDSVFQPFSTNLEMVLNKDMDIDSNVQAIPGFIFPASAAQAQELISNLSSSFGGKGYTIFLLDQHFGIGGRGDLVAVVHSLDQYRILRQVQTDGINYDIDNDSLISIIRQFDTRYSLSLRGAGGDWCEFEIRQPSPNWMQMAYEAYLACPDIVEQAQWRSWRKR